MGDPDDAVQVGATRRVRVLGTGRAGGSFAAALQAAGWSVDLRAAPRGDEAASGATDGVDLVLLCVPDAAVAEVAARLTPQQGTVVAHCSGSLGLDVLAPAPRRASVHPLVSMADATRGAAALRGAWFAVAGDPIASEVVAALDGHAVEVPDDRRALYHAAAVIASNHLVALLGQVERLAAELDLPLEAFLALVRGTVDNVAAVGAADALTGPVARGDWATLRRHLAALAPDERAAYVALASAAARLAGWDDDTLSTAGLDGPTGRT
jgi:predicted short-subunit dehydrogenase-like oxidoreductase (DUF2520 family)